MGLIEGLVVWSKEALLPLGTQGIFAVTVLDAAIFPIPPHLLLIPLVLASPESGLLFAAIATIGATIGSLIGYMIGFEGGKPLLHHFKKRSKKAKKYFDRYGTWAIAISGLTPIPPSVVSIIAGAFHFNFLKVVVASFIGRAAAFFPIAIILMLFGEAMVTFLDQFLLVFLLIALAGFVFAKRKAILNRIK